MLAVGRDASSWRISAHARCGEHTWRGALAGGIALAYDKALVESFFARPNELLDRTTFASGTTHHST